jgi:hypothetical protein
MKITFFLRDKNYELITESTGNEYIPPIGTEVWFDDDNNDNLRGFVDEYTYDIHNDNLIITCLDYEK